MIASSVESAVSASSLSSSILSSWRSPCVKLVKVGIIWLRYGDSLLPMLFAMMDRHWTWMIVSDFG